MRVIGLSKSKIIGTTCIDCTCKNPECEYFNAAGFFVDGGCAILPAGSIVSLKCSKCGYQWKTVFNFHRDDPNPDIVEIEPTNCHLFGGIGDENATKLINVLIDIYEEIFGIQKWEDFIEGK